MSTSGGGRPRADKIRAFMTSMPCLTVPRLQGDYGDALSALQPAHVDQMRTIARTGLGGAFVASWAASYDLSGRNGKELTIDLLKIPQPSLNCHVTVENRIRVGLTILSTWKQHRTPLTFV